MDMKELSKVLLDIFYIIVGTMMILTMFSTIKDTENKKDGGTSAFWGMLGIIFIFGQYIPAEVSGALILIIGVISALNQVNMGTIKQLSEEFAKKKAEEIGLKIFIPSFIIAFAALFIAQFTSISGVAAIGISAVCALIVTVIITKAAPSEILNDTSRMMKSVGETAILSQLLASLGALFTAAGVGEIISGMISKIIPEGNIWIGITAYCVGMALFTMIMGNAYAAFTVITVGIGVPFVFAHGANPIAASALAMTAGFCGTLVTPMAANFNILPVALLEIDDKNAVIKTQSLFALALLIIHIPLMYFLAF